MDFSHSWATVIPKFSRDTIDNTHLEASRYIKSENASLPVDVRRLKRLVSNFSLWSQAFLVSLFNLLIVSFCSLQLQGNEPSNIARCFKSKDFMPFMTDGVYVEGTRYLFLRMLDDKLVLAKKIESGALCIQATMTAVVIGHCTEGGQQENANKAVGIIGDYMESLNM